MLLASGGLARALSSDGGGERVTVEPTAGLPTTRFIVSFNTAAPGGRNLAGASQYRVDAINRGPASGCLATVARSVAGSRAGVRGIVPLDPVGLGGRWCPGLFHGWVVQTWSTCRSPVHCSRGRSLSRVVGRFLFTVRPGPGTSTGTTGTSTGTTGTQTAPSGQDTTPPTFAGIKSAFACTPGPQQPGQTTPFTLTWTAATDDVTPSSLIIYDIYVATVSGGENFGQPTWTTGPGVTSYRTPGLPSHGTFYFVVRARDQAGNDDQNVVEVRGVDPCV
jgi:hypothetical protein